LGFDSLIPWAKFEGAIQSPVEVLVPPFQRITSGRTSRVVRHRHLRKASLHSSTGSLPGGNFNDREEGVLFPALKKEA